MHSEGARSRSNALRIVFIECLYGVKCAFRLYFFIMVSKELFPFCLRPGQGEVTMQAFLKGASISTKPPPTKDRGVTATARSSGENKKAKPVPWVEK